MTVLQQVAIVVGVVSGVVGSVLGIVNFRLRVLDRKPQLRVRVHWTAVNALNPGGGGTRELTLAFNVANLGALNVNCLVVGFEVKGKKGERDFTIPNPIPIGNDHLPCWIEPGDSKRYGFLHKRMPKATEIRKAYCKSMTGDRFYASRRDTKKLKSVLTELQAGRQPKPDDNLVVRVAN